MNVRAILHALSIMLLILGIAIVACFGLSFLLGDPPEARSALAVSAVVPLVLGLGLRRLTARAYELSRREGMLVVSVGWLITCAFGALPYVLSGAVRSPVAALFESVSGFTTTGASVIADVESLPRGILLWRSVTHFLGGMGVLVLCVAILPFLGTSGMSLYRAEMAGPSKDRLTPRIKSTAKRLWALYAFLCFACAALLRAGGVNWHESFCHAFGAVATGGFSTRNNGVAGFHSVYVELVLMAFMFLGATSFTLHLRALRGEVTAWFRDAEWRFFVGFWLLGALLVFLNTWPSQPVPMGQSLRDCFFSTLSAVSTTGFGTADFAQWPVASRIILMLLMIVGGCTGSTAGAVKQLRALVLCKLIGAEIRRFVQPQVVVATRAGRTVIGESTAHAMVLFVALYALTVVAASLAMSFFVADGEVAISSVIATLGGVGPGLADVGPLGNYMAIPDGGKGVLILCMLLGRLEFITFLALALPSFWRK
jgi:trk system potassium uptake protein TrkH